MKTTYRTLEVNHFNRLLLVEERVYVIHMQKFYCCSTVEDEYRCQILCDLPIPSVIFTISHPQVVKLIG